MAARSRSPSPPPDYYILQNVPGARGAEVRVIPA